MTKGRLDLPFFASERFCFEKQKGQLPLPFENAMQILSDHFLLFQFGD